MKPKLTLRALRDKITLLLIKIDDSGENYFELSEDCISRIDKKFWNVKNKTPCNISKYYIQDWRDWLSNATPAALKEAIVNGQRVNELMIICNDIWERL